MKQILGALPILIFFLVYKFSYIVTTQVQPIIAATFSLVVMSAFSLVYHKILKKQQDKMAFYSNIAIIIFGSATVLMHDSSFIKMKITIINLLFGFYMLYNVFHKNPPVQKIFKEKIQMDIKYWQAFSLRIAIMFFAIAIANELVYRNFPENVWVKFKVFYAPIFSFVYFLLQIRFLTKNSKISK